MILLSLTKATKWSVSVSILGVGCTKTCQSKAESDLGLFRSCCIYYYLLEHSWQNSLGSTFLLTRERTIYRTGLYINSYPLRIIFYHECTFCHIFLRWHRRFKFWWVDGWDKKNKIKKNKRKSEDYCRLWFIPRRRRTSKQKPLVVPPERTERLALFILWGTCLFGTMTSKTW